MDELIFFRVQTTNQTVTLIMYDGWLEWLGPPSYTCGFQRRECKKLWGLNLIRKPFEFGCGSYPSLFLCVRDKLYLLFNHSSIWGRVWASIRLFMHVLAESAGPECDVAACCLNRNATNCWPFARANFWACVMRFKGSVFDLGHIGHWCCESQGLPACNLT